MGKIQIKEAILMDNGNLLVSDYEGNQIAELQGQYSFETHKRILLASDEKTRISGFDIIPTSFKSEIKSFVDYWKSHGWSYESYLDSKG